MPRHRRSSSPVLPLIVIWMLALSLPLAIAARPLPAGSPLVQPQVAPEPHLSLGPLSEVGGPLGPILVSGSYAYVREGGMLVVLDVSDPARPTPVGSLATPFGRAELVGALLYVAAGDLRIIDVSNPRLPQLVGSVITPGEASDVAVAGSLAYVADGGAGLQIVDVSNRGAPRIVGGFDTRGEARALALAGNLAYVADSLYGLQIIDVSNAAGPTRRGGIDQLGFALDVQVANGYAYITAGPATRLEPGGLLTIDVRNPADPRIRSTYSAGYSPQMMQIVGNLAYIGGGGNLEIVDVSDPAKPVRRGGYNLSGPFTVVGSRLYGISPGISVDALYIVDVSDPAQPDLLGAYDTMGYAIDVQAVGDTVYVSDIERGFWVVDVRDPARPLLRGVFGLPDPARDMQIIGKIAYLLVGSSLLIVDISDLNDPQLIGVYDDLRDAQKIEIVGERVYIAGGGAGLLIVDISHPDEPTLLGGYATAGPAFSLAVVGGLAYVADGAAGLQIVDVGDPASPSLISSYAPANGGGARDVVVNNPARPTRRGSTPTKGINVELTLAGGLAYVTEFTQIEVIDVGNVSQPRVRAEYQRALPGGSAGNVAVRDEIVFVADAQAGLKILRARLLPYGFFLPLLPR
jgi:hypothetical protein